MSEISELQAQIAGALDRIAYGLENLGHVDPALAAETEELANLRAKLDDERTANAQLEDRVRTIKEKQDGTVDRLASEVDRLTKLLSTQEETVSRLARVNAELRANNQALRDAISEGVAEPHLINKAMMAELEALRMAQVADRAEIDSVLSELDVMIASAEEEGARDA